jgi:hypothetical protein
VKGEHVQSSASAVSSPMNTRARPCYVCRENPADSEDPRYCKDCLRIGREEDDSASVEYYEDEFIELRGKRYPSIKLSGNTQLCSECKRPIYEIPLLLWADRGRLMVAFCQECFEKLKLWELMGGGGRRDDIGWD